LRRCLMLAIHTRYCCACQGSSLLVSPTARVTQELAKECANKLFISLD
jgi:hypothetical protein